MKVTGLTYLILLERITIDPEVMGGQPCIRGLRIPVSFIVKLLATGRTRGDILEDYPELEEEDIYESSVWNTRRGHNPFKKALTENKLFIR